MNDPTGKTRIRPRTSQDRPISTWCTGKLIENSRYLAYEWQMLIGCHKLLAAHVHDQDPITRRALVESRLLHTRALIAFFADCCPHRNDVHVLRWFEETGEDYACILTRIPFDLFSKEYERLNKTLAHISAQRRFRLLDDYQPEVVASLNSLLGVFTNRAYGYVDKKVMDLSKQYATLQISDCAYSTRGVGQDNPEVIDYRAQ